MLTFPELRGARFGPLHLDLLAQAHKRFYEDEVIPVLTHQGVLSNPLLDPETCLAMIHEAQARLGIHHSYGGYFEDRSTLWRQSYLEHKQEWIHLGVDFNVPVATKVAATWYGKVDWIDDDSPTPGGWGPRVIVRLRDYPDTVLIFAHLGAIFCKEGTLLKPGDVFAEVGAPPNNGSWFPHLHVQAVDLSQYKKNWLSLVHELDGYTNRFSAGGAAVIFPDPMQFVRLWS